MIPGLARISPPTYGGAIGSAAWTHGRAPMDLISTTI
jgi:hypothetical protein